MNILKGIIHHIFTEGDLSYLTIKVQEQDFGVLMLDVLSFEGAKIGHQVALLFKETEVLLASSTSLVSARTAFVSPVTRIIQGKLLWQVFLDFKGTEISSIITAKAAEELNIQPFKELLWFVKANDITLQSITDTKLC